MEVRRSHDSIGLHISDIQVWRNDFATAVEWCSPSAQQQKWQIDSLHMALERELKLLETLKLSGRMAGNTCMETV